MRSNKNSKVLTRQNISLKTKKEVIALADTGLSHQLIADMFNLGRSTVTKIMKNRSKIEDNIIQSHTDNRKRIRTSTMAQLEFELVKWCTKSTMQDAISSSSHYITEMGDVVTFNIQEDISSKDILSKAKELSKIMNVKNFDFSNAWLKRFRDKFNLNFEIEKKKRGPIPKEKKMQNKNENEENDSHSIFIVKSNVPDFNSLAWLSSSDNINYNNQFLSSAFFTEYMNIYNNIPMFNINQNQLFFNAGSFYPDFSQDFSQMNLLGFNGINNAYMDQFYII